MYGSQMPSASLPQPTGKSVLEGYRSDILTNFEGDQPRYNPMNQAHVQSSMLLNMNDPIQMHLLLSTATDDAREYELLSFEEVEGLKKLVRSLEQRVRQTRHNLVVQSKLKDAAINMARLYSGGGRGNGGDGDGEKRPRHRLSLIRHSHTEQLKEADQERLAAERRCEELAQELWGLERRLMEPQMRLMKHTAGVLALAQTQQEQKANARFNNQPVPGSPESMVTYGRHSRDVSLNNEEDVFDERSAYKPFERLDEVGRRSFDSRRGDSPHHRGGSSSTEVLRIKEDADRAHTRIAQTEDRLDTLNNRLREVIIRALPTHDQAYTRPPHLSPVERTQEPGYLLDAHLDYLEQGLSVIDEEHALLSRDREESDRVMEQTIGELNREVRALLLPFDPDLQQPPQLTGRSLKEQLLYFQRSVEVVENELQRAESTRSELTAELQRARSGASDESGSMRTVLEGLWSIIGHDDLDEGDEPEPFNIHAFSAKVQRLFNQSSGLKEQKEVLQRQIKQQRELNNKSDEVKDREITELTEKLEEAQEMLDKTEQQCSDLEHRIADLVEEVENLNMERETTQGEATKNAEQLVLTTRTLQDRNDEIEKLEDELQDLKLNRGVDNAEVTSRLAEADERVAALGAALTQAESKIAELEDSLKSSILEKSAKEEQIVAHTRQISELESGQTSRVAELEQHLEKAKADIDAANLEIARLATEVTIARAELDGAYGSRAQRAAEVAANPMIQNEINTLTSEKERLEKELEQAKGMRGEDRDRMEDLKRELAGMVDEFEAVTRKSVEWERERENLEKEVDKLREVKEELETRLADEKVKALGLRSPGPAGAETPGGTGRVGAGETSTAVLKNEFKKMMRDTRAESARALRVSSSISNCRHAIC
jgi:hypothetical protein